MNSATDPSSLRFAEARLDALLPAILPSSPARMFHEVMEHSPVRADFVGVGRDEVAPPEADGYFGSPDHHVREISGPGYGATGDRAFKGELE
jgi:hypothetical protein